MGTGEKKQAGFDFDRKFVTYALAGSAILGLPALTQAQTVSLTGPTSLGVSFDHSSTIDFTLGTDLFEGAPEIYVTGPLTTSFIGTSATLGTFTELYPVAFPSVAAIDVGAAGSISSGTLLKANTGGTPKGNWPNGTGDAWLGVVFQRSGTEYLGWADIAASLPAGPLPSATATLLDSGFEVLAPEPSSIALLALGAAGIAVLRKRRSAVN